MVNPGLSDYRLDVYYSRLAKPVSEKEILSTFARYLMSIPLFQPSDIFDLHLFFDVRVIEKNDFYFTNHAERKDIGFIVKGAVKLYRDYDCKQQVVNLFKEGFFGTLKPYISIKSPNVYKAVCVEKTMMVTITEKQLQKLFIKHPSFEIFFNEMNEHIFLFLENRMSSLQTQSAQQRYQDLLKNNPELLTRFSLHDIANFLSMQPETLSRIRSVASQKRTEKSFS